MLIPTLVVRSQEDMVLAYQIRSITKQFITRRKHMPACGAIRQCKLLAQQLFNALFPVYRQCGAITYWMYHVQHIIHDFM